MTVTTRDMGNNETVRTGVVKVGGEFLALTLTASKTFRTEKGAAEWLSRRGYRPDGTRV